MDEEETPEKGVALVDRLFEMSVDLCAIFEVDGCFRRVNAAFDALGYAGDELRVLTFLDLVHPDDKAATVADLAKLADGARTVRFESRFRSKSGSYLRLAWSGFFLSPRVVFATARDVTSARDVSECERRQLHEELERQKHQYQAIFDTLPQMIWLKDAANIIVRANAAAAGSIGLRPTDVEGLSTYALYPGQASKYYGDDMDVIHQGTAKLDIVEPYEQTSGEIRWVRTDKTPYRNAEGNVVGVVVSASDVTSWKRAEEERSRLYDQLKRDDELKTRFFANVSHELRTPLTLILGPVEKLLAGDIEEGTRSELEVIRRNARTLLKHVNDLLDIAKFDAGKLTVAYAWVDFVALVHATASQFESVARDRHIDLRIEGGEPVVGQADPDKLQRVLGNVFANAFRFAPAGGVVRCTIRTEDRSDAFSRGAVTIEIADSGPGIEPDMREAVFERFRQADDGVGRRYGGTGLGLAIAREIVAIHRGRIFADAAPEGGALLTIQLPLQPSTTTTSSSSARAAPAVPPPSSVTRTLPGLAEDFVAALEPTREDVRADVTAVAAPDLRSHVLVVEDNVEMNRFIARELAGDYRVTSAFDGAEGLRLARATKPDLVVTDIMMPELDGLSLLRVLRGDAQLSTVPIILLTARVDEETMVSALGGGADDYLTKPFSSRELRARVRAHIELVTTRREVTRRQEEAAQLRLAVKARDEFLSVASHELRTPLSALQLNLQLLSRLPGTMDPQRADRLVVATRACKQMATLIHTLLDVARVATGHMVLDKAEVDLGEVIPELARRFEAELSAAGCTLALDLRGPAVGLWDRLRIEQVLSNLLANAMKFGAGKPIELGCTVDPRGVHVTVRDHGVGIAPENQQRIFRRFEQAVATRQYGGLGLGLWIANDIVSRHGGVLRVESKPGEGAMFTVDLPRAGGGAN